MESIKTKGLIIKSTDYGEANRMIKIFTTDLGIISAGVYGARSKKKGLGASSRLFCWGDILLRGTQDRLRADEISVKEGFYPLSEDIQKLAAAVYFSELAEAAVGTDNPDEQILRLLLNTLYAICYHDVDNLTAKTVYEFRIAAAGGYMPAVDACAACGETQGEQWFDIRRGGVLCARCRRADSIKISPPVLAAIRYILSADEKRIFAFRADRDVITALGRISEEYMTEHFDRKFASLDYLKKVSI